MNRLLENTYLAYNSFIDGELNQYDLMDLIEEGIISADILDSMLEEGAVEAFHALTHGLTTSIPAAIAAGSIPTITTAGIGALGAYGAYKLYKYLKNRKKNFNNRPYKLQH